MKITVKQIAAGTFIALLLLVGNVQASELKNTSLKATETNLQLENWMVNETIWNTNTIKTIDFTQETEFTLELENWMIGDNMWDLNNNFVEETETELQIENWMINNKTCFIEDINVEPALTLENWMISNNICE